MSLTTDSERAATLLRILLYPNGQEIRANEDGTVTMPSWAAAKLADVIEKSAYL